MRKIQFRVWDEYQNKWLEDFVLLPNGEILGTEKDENGHLYLIGIGGDNRYTKCQYTGMKDINNKEIYEGDILYHYHSDKNDQTEGVVRYEEKWGGFYFAENRGMNTNTRYEIIGNIYESSKMEK